MMPTLDLVMIGTTILMGLGVLAAVCVAWAGVWVILREIRNERR
jgi:hypothetical protein